MYQQIKLRQRGGGGRHRQMYTTCNNRLIERYLDIEMNTTCKNGLIDRSLDREVKEVGIGRCIQYVTIDCQRDTQIER